MKVLITERTNLNEKMLKEAFAIVTNPDEADYIISQSTVYYPDLLYKTIYVACEAPRADHRIWCYSNFDNFLYVFCHNPDLSKPNQFPLNSEDKAQFYPSRPNPYPFVTREDTTIRNRGVFYAGLINFFEDSPDAHGGTNLTRLRPILGNLNLQEFPGSITKGIGWFGQTTKPDLWRSQTKPNAIQESDCDFVLAMENTMYPNYLYEKIWDAFACDRVALYLGDPRIEYHIPLDCFVDLRPMFDRETRKIDIKKYKDTIINMTQEEYDRILNNARKFRETCIGEHVRLMNQVTQLIIDKIKEDPLK